MLWENDFSMFVIHISVHLRWKKMLFAHASCHKIKCLHHVDILHKETTCFYKYWTIVSVVVFIDGRMRAAIALASEAGCLALGPTPTVHFRWADLPLQKLTVAISNLKSLLWWFECKQFPSLCLCALLCLLWSILSVWNGYISPVVYFNFWILMHRK